MMALWRIVERESGTIKIDGLDTLTIGLQDLRTALALVPQVRPPRHRTRKTCDADAAGDAGSEDEHAASAQCVHTLPA